MKLLSDYFHIKSEIKNPQKPTSNSPTSQQLSVINAPMNENISIIACAGSGKTTTIINRIENLVNNGVREGAIILTTFTRDATKDMRKKLQKKLGKDNNILVGTMDSISLFFLRKYGYALDQTLNVGEYAVQFLEFLRTSDEKEVFFSEFEYLFVDEFQDINDLQFSIIKEFYNHNTRIIGVGDDGQNIYTFRGSNIKYITNFQKYFRGNTFYLTHNFRSTKQIIDVANYTIEKATYIMPKKMIPIKGYEGEKPQVNFFYNQEDNANFIIGQIKKYKKLDQICIICPMNQMLYKLEEIALINNIPVNIIDRNGIKKGKLTMCTIHKSKGLEWDVVFMIGMNDEIFPPEKDMDKIEEARRLFYVGTTRARKFLYYTFTPISGSKIVSRFISELPKNYINFVGYDKSHIGISEQTRIKNKDGVVENVKNLQVEEISYLRRKNIIPEIKCISELIIHNEMQLPKFVYDQNIQADFGIYMDIIVCRELAIKYNKRIKNNSCLKCISALYIDIIDYQKYIKGTNTDIIKEMIKKRAKKYNLEEVEVFPRNFLPKKWRDKLENSYTNFINKNNNSKDIIIDIWNVSLCEQIIINNRRKMLYINTDLRQINDFGENILFNIEKLFANLQGSNIIIHKSYSIEGLSGEIDFWINKRLWEIKMSNEKKIDFDWILQLMCYKGLMEQDVEGISIYNGLQGRIYHLEDISKIKCTKLVEFISKKNM